MDFIRELANIKTFSRFIVSLLGSSSTGKLTDYDPVILTTILKCLRVCLHPAAILDDVI